MAGNDFAILRARVNGKTDAKFTSWAKELNQRGFPFAVYDYLRLKSEQDAIEQADENRRMRCSRPAIRSVLEFTISIRNSSPKG